MTAALSVVTLPCGCFFRGREFIVDSECEEHNDEKTEFSFDELSPRAKDKARDQYRDHALDYDWWRGTYDDANTIAEMMGIEIATKTVPLHSGKHRYDPAIWFTGFCSQGDGACFEGRWNPVSDPLLSLSKVMAHAPADARLHEIALDLADLSERCNAARVEPYVKVSHSGHYYHARCTDFEIEIPTPDHVDEDNELQVMVLNAILSKHRLMYDDFEGKVKDTLRAFMDWIYRQLEGEHDYLTSDEVIDEYLSDLTFDEDGGEV